MNTTISENMNIQYQIPTKRPYSFESGFSKTNLNANLLAEVERVKKVIEKVPSLGEIGLEYITCLLNKVSQNMHLLNKKKQKNSHLSAIFCVKMKDLEGLQLLVANEADINETDKRNCTALHYAASISSEDPAYIKTLLLHPKIDASISSKRGQKAVDLVGNTEIVELFQKN